MLHAHDIHDEIHAQNLYVHMMEQQQHDVPGNASSPALQDHDSTFSSGWGWADSYNLCISIFNISTTFAFSLSLDMKISGALALMHGGAGFNSLLHAF